MRLDMKIIRSTVSLATLHNRRDFGKRNATLEKFAKTDKEIARKDFDLSIKKSLQMKEKNYA